MSKIILTLLVASLFLCSGAFAVSLSSKAPSNQTSAPINHTPVGTGITVVCPPGGIYEGEPACGQDYVDMYNGGCNSTPFVFQPIASGDTICGTSGVFDYYGSSYRDTDWFTIDVAENCDLSWCGVADFGLLLFIIDAGSGNCSDYSILTYGIANPGETICLSAAITPGTYWLWAGPSAWDPNWPCPIDYVAWVDGCVPVPPNCTEVSMVPDVYPIFVAPGGTFGYTGYLNNPLPDPVAHDVWVGVNYQNVFHQLWFFQNIPLAPGQSTSLHLDQYVPICIEPGSYFYKAYSGDYPTPCDSAKFSFVVTGGGGGPYSVLLVTADYPGDDQAAKDLLLASGQVIAADSYDAISGTPALADLLPYDVVMVWSNYQFADATALGDVLADYVEAGGAVVTAEFAHYDGWALTGRYMTQYSPAGQGSSGYVNANLVVLDGGHPIMSGVAVGTEFYDYDYPLQGNTYMVQNWDNGYNGCVVNTDFPQCVAINDYFGMSYAQWTGDVGTMMVNAVLYAAGNAVGIWSGDLNGEMAQYAAMPGKAQSSMKVANTSRPATEVIAERNGIIPTQFGLVDAYPNPFNAQTNITFSMPTAGNVNLDIYNLMGQKVATLVNGNMEAGQHSITWDAANFSSGIYFYKLTAGENTVTKRMALLK